VSDSADIRLKVTVSDVWDTVIVTVSPTTALGGVKAEALEEALGRRPDPTAYLLKYRGAEVLDESQTVGDLGIGSGAPLIVLPRHRRPVW